MKIKSASAYEKYYTTNWQSLHRAFCTQPSRPSASGMRSLERKVQDYMKEIAVTKMFLKDKDGKIEVVLWKEFEE